MVGDQSRKQDNGQNGNGSGGGQAAGEGQGDSGQDEQGDSLERTGWQDSLVDEAAEGDPVSFAIHHAQCSYGRDESQGEPHKGVNDERPAGEVVDQGGGNDGDQRNGQKQAESQGVELEITG